MSKIDLNCDLGESFGNYKLGMDEIVIPYISSANIACGFHASDPDVMAHTVELAKKHNIAVGAHPGFSDLQGFGRRNMNLTPKEAKTCVQYQIGALMAFCRANGIPMQHVKPHGALYNMAAKDYALSLAICEGIYEVDPSLILLGLAGSHMITAAKETGLKAASELFADRAYEEDGSLVARSKPGAVIKDETLAIERVLMMVKEQKVIAITGKEIPIHGDSICVHGDGEKAVAFVQKIRERLTEEGVSIVPLRDL